MSSTIEDRKSHLCNFPGCLFRCEWALLLYSFGHAAVSQAPVIFAFVYMVDNLKYDPPVAGFVLGAFCFCRFLGACFVGLQLSNLSMVWASILSFCAWTLIAYFDKYHEDIFAGSFIVLGLSDTAAGVDTLLRIEGLVNRRSPLEVQHVIRLKFVVDCLGSVLAYLGGGALYQEAGLYDFGRCCAAISLLKFLPLVALSLYRRLYRLSQITIDDVLAEVITSAVDSGSNYISRPTIKSMRFTMAPFEQMEVYNSEKPVKSGAQPQPRWMFHVAVTAFMFSAFGGSIQLVMAMFFWNTAWSIGTWKVGCMMAGGQILALVGLAICACLSTFVFGVPSWFQPPVQTLVACAGAGVAYCLLGLRQVILCSLGTVAVHMFYTWIEYIQVGNFAEVTTLNETPCLILFSLAVKHCANGLGVIGAIYAVERFGLDNAYIIVGSALALIIVIILPIFVFFAYFLVPPYSKKLSNQSVLSHSDCQSRCEISSAGDASSYASESEVYGFGNSEGSIESAYGRSMCGSPNEKLEPFSGFGPDVSRTFGSVIGKKQAGLDNGENVSDFFSI